MYYCITLQDCNEYGVTDAVILKKSIDDIFISNLQSNGNEQNALLEKKFEGNLIPAAADGASVNFGKYGWLITRM